jgi:Rrf2 family protein
MQITRTADYGVRVLTVLAMRPPQTRLTAAELAGQSGASVTFVAKILQRLVASRLVVSHRGFEGGFELGRDPRTVSVLDIVTALDGPLCLNACLPGGAGCEGATWCAAREVWTRAQAALSNVLATESLDRLALDTARYIGHRPSAPAPATPMLEPVAGVER